MNFPLHQKFRWAAIISPSYKCIFWLIHIITVKEVRYSMPDMFCLFNESFTLGSENLWKMCWCIHFFLVMYIRRRHPSVLLDQWKKNPNQHKLVNTRQLYKSMLVAAASAVSTQVRTIYMGYREMSKFSRGVSCVRLLSPRCAGTLARGFRRARRSAAVGRPEREIMYNV